MCHDYNNDIDAFHKKKEYIQSTNNHCRIVTTIPRCVSELKCLTGYRVLTFNLIWSPDLSESVDLLKSLFFISFLSELPKKGRVRVMGNLI